MRHILYARKSSEGTDRQIQSLEDQRKLLRELAARTGLTIVDELEEAKSAKAPGERPVFAAMLARLEAGEADAILCWAIDRLTRNPVDGGALAWMLQRGALTAIRTFEREYRREDSALLLSLETGFANDYVLRLGKNVSRGLAEKAARGRWPFKAPPGYANAIRHRDGVPVPMIVPDPKRFPLIKRAWEMAASGSTVADVLRTLNDQGYLQRSSRGRPGRPIARSSLHRMFQNPFYHGWFRYKGELIRGRHVPMISESLFRAARRSIERADAYRPQRHGFAFTGLIRCGDCGCAVTAERRFKGAREYVYYHCTGNRGCSKRSATESEIDEAYRTVLAGLRVPDSVNDLIVSFLERTRFEVEEGDALVERTRAETIRVLERKLDVLFEMRTGSEISPEEFVKRKAELTNRVSRLRREAEEAETRRARNAEAIQRALAFVSGAYDRFCGEGIEHKRLVARVLTHTATLQGGVVRIVAHPLLCKIAAIEPPKGPDLPVRKGLRACDFPIKRAIRDEVRTLVNGPDLDFLVVLAEPGPTLAPRRLRPCNETRQVERTPGRTSTGKRTSYANKSGSVASGRVTGLPKVPE